jgi:ABC-type sugar transport system substrate-binding protein
MTRTRLATAFLATALLAGAALPAAAQQMGQAPYSFPGHNPSMAAQLEMANKRASSSGGLGALHQYVISSTSIGNLNEISTILERGAQGYVNVGTDQNSKGDQGSSSSSTSSVDSSVKKTTSVSAGGEGASKTTTAQ